MENNASLQLPTEFDKFGEAILPEAPSVQLANGKKAIPQQFFYNKRTVENVEQILGHISFCRNYPLFVFEEHGHIFIQVGIVGHENYPPTNNLGQRNDKIVYGRKWFIDPYTPTSEVIQTAYLAINKVREHELREQLTVAIDYKKSHLNRHHLIHTLTYRLLRCIKIYFTQIRSAQPIVILKKLSSRDYKHGHWVSSLWM